MQSMLESIRDPIQRLATALAFAPEEVAGWLILALAALVALAIHWIAVRLLHPLLSGRHPYWSALLHATNGPTRLALLVVALVIALPGASFDPTISDIVAKILTVATILLIGWIAMTAGHLAGDLYIARARAEGVDIMLARKHVTQVRVLRQVVDTVIVVLTVSIALMTFDPVRQYGVSLFASAGVAGLVAGLAARPMLSNLIAGLQIATTQPIRLDDEVVVETQWGRVQEINSTYVVLGLWDLRQMIVPLSYFIEKPFENWTREFDHPHRLGVVSPRLHGADRALARRGDRDRQGFAALGRRHRQAAGAGRQGERARAAGDRQRLLFRRRRRAALPHPREGDRIPAAGISGLPAAARRLDGPRRGADRRPRRAAPARSVGLRGGHPRRARPRLQPATRVPMLATSAAQLRRAGGKQAKQGLRKTLLGSPTGRNQPMNKPMQGLA